LMLLNQVVHWEHDSKMCVCARDVPHRDFHYPTDTANYRIPDVDVRTVRNTDS